MSEQVFASQLEALKLKIPYDEDIFGSEENWIAILTDLLKDSCSILLETLYPFDNFEDFLNVVTTGRYNLWVIYSNNWVASPLAMFFGYGLGFPFIDSSGTLSPHNLYLTMVYQLGVVGTILLSVIILSIFIKIFMKTKVNKWAITVPIIIFMLLFMVEDLYI